MSSADIAAPASKVRERSANFSIIMVIVPFLLVIDLSSRLRAAQFFSGPDDGPLTFNVAFFVQLVNTIAGSFQAGNEHLQDSALEPKGRQ
ncbi:hypothetical protein [Mesorhizobium shangrilense]|uniref:Uncharacterized protein n=1 Tax=Mesorhizobium shangrilense TaxID=460060 RepID=A0ABV2DFM1_9HYPH